MNPRGPDLVEVYEAALTRAEAEGFVSAQDREPLERAFRRVAAELEDYRRQLRQVARARQEQARQELKQSSRFLSREALRQIRARLERPEGVAARGQAPMFYGLATAEVAQNRTAKEPSRLGRAGSEKKPATLPESGARSERTRAPQAPGVFGFAMKNRMKPGSMLGAAPRAEAPEAPIARRSL